MNAISSTLTPFKNAGNVNQCSVTQVIIVSLTGRAAVVQFFLLVVFNILILVLYIMQILTS